ncbi:MAG: YqaE/Pmp3 family membrane protein [Kordiimonadaceae bacterium]|jgi:hypothetical protein|nr:YqaE/Pmp3 family membrane protein [Kordiimonadaceae bacterium]
MIYILAIFIPPLALLFKGKIFQAIINGVLWVLGLVFLVLGGFVLWAICVIWAILVVKGANEDERTQKIVDAIKDSKD